MLFSPRGPNNITILVFKVATHSKVTFLSYLQDAFISHRSWLPIFLTRLSGPAIPEPLMPRIFDFFYLDFLDFFAGKNKEVSLRDPNFK